MHLNFFSDVMRRNSRTDDLYNISGFTNELYVSRMDIHVLKRSIMTSVWNLHNYTHHNALNKNSKCFALLNIFLSFSSLPVFSLLLLNHSNIEEHRLCQESQLQALNRRRKMRAGWTELFGSAFPAVK